MSGHREAGGTRTGRWYGQGLWTSDGTRAGTKLVEQLVPGSGMPGPGSSHADTNRSVGSVGKRVFFAADHPTKGIELWVWSRWDRSPMGMTIDTATVLPMKGPRTRIVDVEAVARRSFPGR